MSWLESLNAILKEPVYSVLLGAGVSLCTTLAVQTRAFREARKERARADLEKRQMHCYSLFIKLSSITSDYTGLHKHLTSAMNDLPDPKDTDAIISKLLPLVNYPEKTEFSAEEMANLIHFGARDLFNDLTYVDRRFNSCLDAWRHYGEKRKAIRDAPKKSFDHDSLVLNAAIERGSIIELDLAEAKMMVPAIIQLTEEGLKEASARLHELVRVMNEKMGLRVGLA